MISIDSMLICINRLWSSLKISRPLISWRVWKLFLIAASNSLGIILVFLYQTWRNNCFFRHESLELIIRKIREWYFLSKVVHTKSWGVAHLKFPSKIYLDYDILCEPTYPISGFFLLEGIGGIPPPGDNTGI